MWEVPFAEFCQAKGFGKRGEGHLEETHGIDEPDAIVLDLQEFTTVAELLDDPVVAMVLLDDKVPIVPLKIMSDDIDLTGIVECQGIQPFQKVTGTREAWESLGLIVVFGFGHDEIRNVFFVGLHGFNIEEDV